LPSLSGEGWVHRLPDGTRQCRMLGTFPAAV
jgi:hypothetical protein